MARLDRLSILGIRNYGPEENDSQEISFYSPVTLFLGQNGSGKTTIIESLKFALTGELPPGCKTNAGFVYDPKLANKSEVKGNVKLKVICPNGEELVITKSVQAIQRANKVEFKRLDNTLTRKVPDGEPKSISNRCADIDIEMCVALGVSKSILNNVIFCHQEDAAWPLEEGKKLKERFDSIFDTSKYNKCLISMRDLRKKKMNENKVIIEEVKGLEYKKNEVEKKKYALKEAEKKLTTTVEKIAECEEKMKPINERLEEIKQVEVEYDNSVRNFQMKKQRFEELKKDVKQMAAGLKILDHSDSELEATIAEFDKNLVIKQEELDEWMVKLNEKIDEEKKFLKTFGQEQVVLGQLRNEEKRNETQKAKRDKQLTTICQTLDLTIDPITDTEKANETFATIESKLEEKKVQHEQLIKDLDIEDQELQANIDKCRENKISMEQSTKSKMQQLREIKAEVRKKKREVDEANASSSHLEIIKDKLERNSKDFDSLMSTLNPEELGQQIEDETKKRDEAEKQLEVLDKEVKNLQMYSNVQTELDVNKENMIKHESEVTKLKDKHEEILNKLFNNEIPEGNLKPVLDKKKREHAASMREINSSIKKAQKKVTELETDTKYRNEKLQNLERELADNEKKVADQCNGKPFQEVLNDMKNELENLQKEKGNYSNSKFMFSRFIEKLQEEDPCCPICKRDFADKEADYVKNIVTDISAQIENFPNKLKNIDSELSTKQKQYNKLVQLETVNDRIAKLKDEDIPKIKEELVQVEEDVKKAKEDLENLQQSLTPVQEMHEQIQSISSDIAILDKTQNEFRKVKTKVTDLEEQMSKTTVSTRTLQEASNEQEKTKADMLTARRQVDVLQKRLNSFNEQKQYLQETKNKLIQQQLQIEKNLQSIVQIQARFAELQSNESKLSTEVAILEGDLLPVKKELDAAIDKKAAAKKENKKKIDKSQQELQASQKQIQEVKNIQQTIDEFEKKNITGQLNEIIEKITKLETEKETFQKDRQKLQSQVDGIKNFLVSQQNYRRELNDNKRLREKQREEDEVKKEMEELSAAIQKDNYQSAQREKRKLNEQLNSLKSDRHRGEGRKDELTNTISSLEKELAKEVNVQAEINYRNKLMELKIREKVVDDLNKFTSAVDYAMILYHKEKMEQINRIIRESWRNIYRGNDIDYIEIKADQIQMSGKQERRTHNYRVVQVKNKIELEMRGRCSAGQKVLACLVIRMALADTFSSHCGILALDEPTSNLDRENIVSLCRTLAEVVHQRRNNKHFQLIVITHDKEFLDELSAIEKLDSYYKVSRSPNSKSLIKEIRLS